MKQLSKLIERQHARDGLPMIGVDGYNTAILSFLAGSEILIQF